MVRMMSTQGINMLSLSHLFCDNYFSVNTMRPNKIQNGLFFYLFIFVFPLLIIDLTFEDRDLSHYEFYFKANLH